MKKIKKVIFMTLVSGLLSSLNAHSLWVNSFESFTHKPGHTTVGLGWGHSIPVDDILNSPNGKVIVESFNITTPDNKTMQLRIPSSTVQKPSKTSKVFDLFDADIGLQKIALKKDSPKGVYTIKASTKPTFYTEYIDTKDRKRLKLTTLDKLKDIKKVLMSVKYQAFAKSYLTLGKWTKQKPKNEGLEIIPITDLSNVRVGDLIEFEVYFYGKPLHVSPASIEFITAKSNGFGQNDEYYLFSFLQNGKGKIRVQSPGQWIVSSFHKEDVKKEGALKELYKKVGQVVHSSTLTFNVKE